jgi:hypothetical protein
MRPGILSCVTKSVATYTAAATQYLALCADFLWARTGKAVPYSMRNQVESIQIKDR